MSKIILLIVLHSSSHNIQYMSKVYTCYYVGFRRRDSHLMAIYFGAC